MGLLSFLSGSKKAMDTASNVVDGAISGIDKLFFTQEEKAEASKAILDIVLDRAELAVGESSVRSMTRRFVAFLFVIPYIAMLVFAVVMFKFNPAWATYALKVASMLNNAIIAVVLWFFGSYGVGYLMDKKKNGR